LFNTRTVVTVYWLSEQDVGRTGTERKCGLMYIFTSLEHQTEFSISHPKKLWMLIQ